MSHHPNGTRHLIRQICISNFPFNWPITVRTQILVCRWYGDTEQGCWRCFADRLNGKPISICGAGRDRHLRKSRLHTRSYFRVPFTNAWFPPSESLKQAMAQATGVPKTWVVLEGIWIRLKTVYLASFQCSIMFGAPQLYLKFPKSLTLS